jgi:hypothetical protein
MGFTFRSYQPLQVRFTLSPSLPQKEMVPSNYWICIYVSQNIMEKGKIQHATLCKAYVITQSELLQNSDARL